jgi:branched-chain amino acid transport system substrate-binding protein
LNQNRLGINRNLLICLIIIFSLSVVLALFFVERKVIKPIIIGFSAQLTGGQAELGIQERNGVQLAVEKINASGGIGGRNISLSIHDDKGIPGEAQSGDEELIKEGAVAIIGHATTSQTLAGLKATEPNNTILIAPTVSTPQLSGLADYFFRVHPSFKSSAEMFSRYIYKNDGITRIGIIYDIDNLEYSRTYSTTFANEFKSLGGNITDEISFSSATQPDFFPLLSKMRESKAEGLLILASDIDTALIAQRAKYMNKKIQLFTSAWAQTETLISNGGQEVEGMEIEQAYDLDSQSLNFIDFQSKYRARFGNLPSFGATYSYEAMLVLAEALKNANGNKAGLKQALLETHNFNGLIDTFSFDEFGDVGRPWYLSTIRNGKFVMIDKLT